MRIDVEAEKIEIGRELAAEVDVVDPPQIVEDEPVWIGGAQDQHLIVLEPSRDEGEEAVIVDHMGRPDRGRGVVEGQHHLIEIVVGGGPEMPAPRMVERSDTLVLVLEEGLELGQRHRTVGQRSRGVELIVRLPADDVRIAAIMLGHRFSDALRMFAEHPARKVGVLARAMAHGAAIGIDAQHFGITRRQPTRRRRRRRTHDGLDAGLAQHIDGPVEQIEIERPLMRL